MLSITYDSILVVYWWLYIVEKPRDGPPGFRLSVTAVSGALLTLSLYVLYVLFFYLTSDHRIYSVNGIDTYGVSVLYRYMCVCVCVLSIYIQLDAPLPHTETETET